VAEDDFDFKVGTDGTVEVGGQVVEQRETDILDELPPAEAATVDPEVQRLREKADLYDSFEPVLQRLGRGELTLQEAAPAEPPPPQPEDIAGYHERLSRPGADAILRQVNDYAAVLSSEEAAKLAGDHRVFNAAFDRFFEANRPAQPSPPPSSRPRKEIIDKILAARESRKDSARAESAGTVTGGSEAFGGGHQERSREQEMAALKLRIRRDPSNTDLQAQLAKFYLGGDD
jgi:hypothetical protein